MTRPMSEAAEVTVTLLELVQRARVAAEPVEATWAMTSNLAAVAAKPQRVSEPCQKAARMLQSALAVPPEADGPASLRRSLDVFFAASSLHASLDAVEAVVAAVNKRENRTITLRELPEHRAHAEEAGRAAEQALRHAVPALFVEYDALVAPHQWPDGHREEGLSPHNALVLSSAFSHDTQDRSGLHAWAGEEPSLRALQAYVGRLPRELRDAMSRAYSRIDAEGLDAEFTAIVSAEDWGDGVQRSPSGADQLADAGKLWREAHLLPARSTVDVLRFMLVADAQSSVPHEVFLTGGRRHVRSLADLCERELLGPRTPAATDDSRSRGRLPAEVCAAYWAERTKGSSRGAALVSALATPAAAGEVAKPVQVAHPVPASHRHGAPPSRPGQRPGIRA
jgi:hypothetical protein